MNSITCECRQFGYAQVLCRSYLKQLEDSVGDQTPLVRQWIVLRTLCAKHYGITVRELAEEMGVSDKTIRRDLEAFQRAGFPLEESERQKLMKGLVDYFPRQKKVDFDDDPDLGFGIRLLAGDKKWEWNLNRYINDLEDEIVRTLSMVK